jgi:LmbE family N-acetylglucosaminyl deacetylase
MLSIRLGDHQPRIDHVLCLGAHCDDLEIGCAGTVLSLVGGPHPPAVTWVVFASDETRHAEALQAAEMLLREASQVQIVIKKFRDGFLPYDGALVKEAFEDLKGMVSPDLVLTHYRHDLHQDHRLISELTWNTFRNHVILEYEIPKYDGDLGIPNFFVPLDESLCRRKVETILQSFPSQRHKRWFSGDVFWSLMRLRGMECNAPSSYAEAFYCRKLVAAL